MVPWILLLLSGLIILAACIFMIVAAFRVHIGWGLAVLFLGPIAGFIFLVTHWTEGKNAFWLWVLGNIMMFAAVYLLPFSELEKLRGFDPQPESQNESALPVPSFMRESAATVETEASPPAAKEGESWWGKKKASTENATASDAPASGARYVGMQVDAVLKQLGKPRAEMTVGKQKVFQYPGLELISEDGITISRQKALGGR
ncbi:MAG: hypothetical protein HY343_05520 [Lentisphaerae bacterium]|nr:hypothetical protein [Lentisphaerota bacterium]